MLLLGLAPHVRQEEQIEGGAASASSTKTARQGTCITRTRPTRAASTCSMWPTTTLTSSRRGATKSPSAVPAGSDDVTSTPTPPPRRATENRNVIEAWRYRVCYGDVSRAFRRSSTTGNARERPALLLGGEDGGSGASTRPVGGRPTSDNTAEDGGHEDSVTRSRPRRQHAARPVDGGACNAHGLLDE
jgi:hypothetical protein